MSVDAWFKPPLTVFIVWGGFVLCFLLCGSSKRLCRFFCCDCDDENIDYDEETYEHLSSRRRQELDSLRSIAILRQLAKFTLVLKKENMKKQLPDSDPQCLDCKDKLSDIAEPDTGEVSSGDEGGNQKEISIVDVEKGLKNSTGASTNDDVAVEAMEDDIQYTHVLVPYPSYDIDGKHVMEMVEECSEKEKRSKSIKDKILFRKSKANTEEEDNNDESVKEGGESKEDECATEVEDEAKELVDTKMTEKRLVPIFCAVCLMEYDINERICWASNGECTHVFHEDCILQWLVSLGKKRSKRQSFPRNPSDKKLLDYSMECPCCRQDFVSRNLVFAPPVAEGEENV